MLGTFVCRILLVSAGCDFNVWLSGCFCFCLLAKALYKLCFIKTTIKIKLIIIIIIIFSFGSAPDLNLDLFLMKDCKKQGKIWNELFTYT